MSPELIVMLTYNDQTVENALELFTTCSDLPVKHWGFKDIGLPREEIKKVVKAMNSVDKSTYLEVVSLSEAEGLAGARLAVECGFDVLMGTVFFDSIHEFLRDKPVKYFPFLGKVSGQPSILDGTIAEIEQQIQNMIQKGVDGFDLLTYRYTGEPINLLNSAVKAANGHPLVSAGSIDSFNRIHEVSRANAWGFTIGTALFDQKFEPTGSFRDNLIAVCNWLSQNRKNS